MFAYTSLDSALFRNENVCFGLSDRFGGVSQGAFESLNIGLNVNDNAKDVRENHRRVSAAFTRLFGIESNAKLSAESNTESGIKSLILTPYFCEQIHSTRCIVLDEELKSQLGQRGAMIEGQDSSGQARRQDLDSLDRGVGEVDLARQSGQDIGQDVKRADSNALKSASICLGRADGIITHLQNTLLFVLVADCNPILLYDRRHRVLAVLHAGRRGVFDGIAKSAFRQMQGRYDTRAKDCLVYIGASIRVCCYEVGDEVAQEARQLGFESALQGRYLNLIECLKIQLARLGFEERQLEISPLCSCCEGRFYSYRREKLTGRFGLFAMLR